MSTTSICQECGRDCHSLRECQQAQKRAGRTTCRRCGLPFSMCEIVECPNRRLVGVDFLKKQAALKEAP